MSYSDWKRAQQEPARFAEAGIPYKTPSQLREEAAEMRRIAENTTFVTDAK